MLWSFQALGTTWWIEIFDTLAEQTGDEVKDFVTSFVSRYEHNYSRFKSDSQISRLNRDRKLSNPSAEMVSLLEYGKQLYLRTDTHFNLLTGHILESKGYDATYSFESSANQLIAGNPITDLSISSDQITITHGNVDLGGYGKGYLIDLLVHECKARFGIEQFLINGGGDMFGTHIDGQAIEIHLEHPRNQGQILASTYLHNQGFAASSPYRRVWHNATGSHHHIIADTLTTDGSFLKAATAADADAFATTILQLDTAKTEALAQSENLTVAHFNTATNLLTKSRNFD